MACGVWRGIFGARVVVRFHAICFGEAEWIEDVPVHGHALLGDPFAHELGSDGREQDAVAVMAGGQIEAVERRPADSAAS